MEIQILNCKAKCWYKRILPKLPWKQSVQGVKKQPSSAPAMFMRLRCTIISGTQKYAFPGMQALWVLIIWIFLIPYGRGGPKTVAESSSYAEEAGTSVILDYKAKPLPRIWPG
jgi:hypothetical protein